MGKAINGFVMEQKSAVSEMNRKGFFFTVDVFIALSFLIIGFLFVYSAYLSAPQSTQTIFYSNDLISFFTNTKISELDNAEIFTMWCDSCAGATHNISNPDNTILEQILEFTYLNKTGLAEVLANISRGIIRDQYSYQMNITLDEKSWVMASNYRIDMNSSKLALTSKDISYFLLNYSEVIGPFITRIEVWT